MVVELRYDGDPTFAGDTPFGSDNLAQRNLVILRSDNPGSPITRTVEHSFEADTSCLACKDHDKGRDDDHVHPEPAKAVTFLTTRRAIARAASQARAPEDFRHVHVDESGTVTRGPAPTHEHGHGHGHEHGEPGPAPQGRSFPFAFDGVDWKPVGQLLDELVFVWNGLPETARVELYLPGVRAEDVINLRNLRHAPRDVRILDEHRLLLVPGGVTYVPLPPTAAERVAGVVTVTLPDGVRHGDRWKVDVLQLRGHERRGLGAFQLDIRVDKDIADLAESERRLLEILAERRSLLERGDRWRPILDRRVATARARARAFAERAGVAWEDPTTWIDRDGTVRDVVGPRLSVVVDRIEIRKDFDPWIKGRGEIAFLARVETADNGGRRVRTRLPERGVYKIGDTPGHNVLELGTTIFVGHAEHDLRIEVVGTEKDHLDPDDWIGKCSRVLCGPAGTWFGDYGPQPGVITPEDVGPWRIWYRIVRGG
jgi:hypothetical protein